MNLIDESKYKKIDEKCYYPTLGKFEGYTSFPQPISSPFFNCKDTGSTEKNKLKLIETLNKNFKCEKVLEIFNKKVNQGISYFTSPLGSNADSESNSKKDKIRLLKIIDDYFEEYRLKNKYKLNSNYKVYNIDNKDIEETIKVDAVVTEPYFGPFFKKIPKYEEVLKIINEIEQIYYDLLKKLKVIVRKNGLIIFPVPLYKTSKGKVTIDFENIVKEIGFEIYSPVNSIKIPLNYSIKGNIVERLIYILKN
jgi:hypothetical protein